MIERYITMRCDICKCCSDYEDLAIVNEPQFRRDLKERGWRFERETRMHDKKDICPSCSWEAKNDD
jgi:hypothetical protein